MLRVATGRGEISVVGPGLTLHDGEEAIFSGSHHEDPRYGPQFRALSFTPVTPDTREGIRRFLTSGLVKGIGESTAERLLAQFGERVLEVLDDDPDAIAKVPAIGKKRAKTIIASYREHRQYRDLLVFLQTHAVGTALALRIHKRYGSAALDVIRENPYRLALEVKGIGFLTADRLALSMGLDPLSVDRAEAGLVHLLEEALVAGHLYLPEDDLREACETRLKTRPDVVGQAVVRLATGGRIVRDRGAAYLTQAHQAEEFVAAALAARSTGSRAAGAFGPAMARISRELGLELTAEQTGAAALAVEGRIAAITGGPGTGKTTLVKAIVGAAAELRLRVELASPTGRAAKRLAEATGQSARTVHRLLEFDPEVGAFARNRHAPLDADLVVVDEASMIDIWLMASILDALPPRAKLALVGDADQLPSVGPGSVFADVIGSGVVPVSRLTHIHRQAQGSLIVENAHRILRGERPEVPERTEVDAGQDFFIVWEEEPERIGRMVKLLVSERIPKRFGFDPLKEIMVLAPMHRGVAGVANLNRELQANLNPVGAELVRGEQRLRVGDKVMQLRNDYEKEIFNGDVGRVAAIDARERTLALDLDGRIIEYVADEIDDLQLAYVSTVHKSQGSEYPAVIIVLAREHHIMCQRNLLYTAVTRAKSLAVIVGSRAAVHRAVQNDQVQRRNRRLRERLKDAAARPSPGERHV